MKTLFFCFPDQATFLANMPRKFEQVGETGYPLPPGTEAIRIIGEMRIGGKWDEDGNEIETPLIVPGFHVNALGGVPATWSEYEVFPATPQGVFG